MNWILINKVLALIGPKTRLAYFVTTPACLGIIQLFNRASHPLEVNLPVTVALSYGLTLCFAVVVVLHDVFCPDLVKAVTNQREYFNNRTKLIEEMERYRAHTFDHAKAIISERQEILKRDLQLELSAIFEKEKAAEIAEGLSERVHKLSETLQQLRSNSEVTGVAEANSPKSDNRPALIACFVFTTLGVACAIGALSFVAVPVVLSIYSWLGRVL